ncbi:MAG: RNA polymerase sigma factor [Myxococcota bacterium]
MSDHELSTFDEGPEQEERPLLEGVQRGDAQALERLYATYHDRVLRMALHRGCPRPEAEDVMHEVFLALWRKPPAWDGMTLATWLYRVTANKVASLHRRKAVRRAFALAESAIKPANVSGGASIEARNAVEAVLSRMRPSRREVLVLFEVEGRTGPEIAELVGCRPATVWTRLHYARRDFESIARKLGVEVSR